jgi:outer membrane immunogenic protein
MRSKLSLILSSFALGVIATSAWADGMVEPTASACCGEAKFAGVYVGGAVGWGQHRNEVTNTTTGAPAAGLTFKDTENEFTFGGYVGYNFQRCCSHFVFGVETDFNYLNSSPTAIDFEPGVGGFPPEITALKSNIDWFGTLRGRAGFVVHDHVLLYATGGLAYGNVNHTLTDNCVGCGTPPGSNLGTFSQSNSKTKVGWTVGGGAEMLHDEHWVLRAEALFVDLGSESHSYTITNGGLMANSSADWDDQFWVARLGVAYKFGGPDCCAAPLK